ncbi:SKI/SNO/DAC family protein, partial [Ostertagia ostertagi]
QSSIIPQEFSTFESNEPAIPKEINYRGQTVVGFDLRGTDMLCLPQVYELFLKNMVGGLHTVYTKLKRLEITPIICNVEQYDSRIRTYQASTRPGRPPKRTSAVEEWVAKRDKFEEHQTQCGNESDFGVAPCTTQMNPLFLGQLLPQFSAQQLLVQHMMVLAAAQKQPEMYTPSSMASMTISADADVEGAPLNLSKSNSNSETSDSDSLENIRKESDISPNQSERGGSNSNNSSSSSSDPSTAAATKIISLIDMASEHFKHQMESIRKEREEVESLRCQLKGSLIDESKLREQLQAEKKKSNIYFRRYCKARREMSLLKEQMSETRGGSSNSNSTA